MGTGRGVRRYKLVLIEMAYNVRVNPAWGVAGLVGAVAGPVGAAAPVGPAVKAPWSVSKPSTWPKTHVPVQTYMYRYVEY
eukprot:COSAG06_NODE_2101_length_7596_cov_8.223956_10_plen_80_part_00